MKHIHFIGIGGISMSGIACAMKSLGYQVTGSDRQIGDTYPLLMQAGIPVRIPQQAENITPDIDTVVYTAAIHEDNPELIAARKSGAEVLSRAEMLGRLFDHYDTPIAVAGSHGKTSTSSILAHIYMAAGRDPSFNIGGILHNTGTNFRIGQGDPMIIEACEYTDSFLHFHAKYNIITNIEPEHLDYFRTFENEQHSFQQYVEGMKEGGVLVTSPALKPLFVSLIKDKNIRIVTASLDEEADFTVSDVIHHETGLGYSFHLIENGKDHGRLDLFVPGLHMVYDALLAAALSVSEGVPFDAVREGIAAYQSTKKRFEYLGEYHGAKVIDDYAHHPTEIKAQLKAAREVPFKELYVVFQPHTYSRTITFFDDFVDALSMADHVILCDIYAAREVDTGEVSSAMLAEALRKQGVDAVHIPVFEEIEKYLEKKISTDDMLITMGAGNAVKIATDLLSSSEIQ